jgi:hypothetical protein
MTEITRPQSPSAADKTTGVINPADYNADLASAALAKALMEKFPTPAIDTRKFTIIHGLMESLNHVDDKNETYIDTSRLIHLMDRVSQKSVNVDGKLFNSVWAYLMHPKYIIQGMPSTPTQPEEKPNIFQRMFGWGKKPQEAPAK